MRIRILQISWLYLKNGIKILQISRLLEKEDQNPTYLVTVLDKHEENHDREDPKWFRKIHPAEIDKRPVCLHQASQRPLSADTVLEVYRQSRQGV